MLVKILGAMDILSAIVFLMLTFGMPSIIPLTIFCAAVLFTKSLFIIIGNTLSILDLISSILLILSLVFSLPVVMLWIPAFLLLAKGFVSFL